MQRNLKRPRTSEVPATLFDRIAVAFASGSLTFVLGGILLFAPTPIGFGFTSKGAFFALLAASVVIGALGYALRMNVVAGIASTLANWVVSWW